MSKLPQDARIYVAGHNGMVGSALCRQLEAAGHEAILTRSSEALDLRRQADVEYFFETQGPEYVYLAAATVGGIQANSTYRAEFLYNNMMIAANVIHAAYRVGVKKLLYLGSSCIYPRMAEQPIRETALLTGPLEPTNEGYALAKIAGLKLCQNYRHQYGCNFISAMPTNLYGPGDHYGLEWGHVVPALIRKFHEAKVNNQPEVEVWGTGTPQRELMHVDDMARACLLLMEAYDAPEPINIGSGEEIQIGDLAKLIQQTVAYPGTIVFNPAMPDGTPRKRLDISRLQQLGFHAQIPLEIGLAQTYADFLATEES